MKSQIRLMIADDFPMFREGLHLLLRHFADIKITGEAEDGAALLSLIEKKQPDVVVTDIQMPVMNGVELTKRIRAEYPAIKVIALSIFGDEDLIMEMLDAGANGYIIKNAPKEEVYEAIETVYRGNPYFCNSTSMKLGKMVAASRKVLSPVQEINFNEKELEIIRLICEQYASKEIADKTKLAHRTVEKYRDRIMEKTGARNVVGIVVYAIKKGLYKP